MEDKRENLYMYILVNNDAKMEKGKIAGQVGHVVGLITEEIIQNYYLERNVRATEAYERYYSWKKKGHAKVVLKATEAQLELFLNDKECVYIRDAGKTQIAPNTLTVVGFYPSIELKNKFKHLKLL
jgi:PTH2 family peptidyl-tRNA hydrolase